VITRVLLGGALQVSPPLVITRAELDEIATGLSAALDASLAVVATTA
jgi:adenosylmethionine-8-amino-7-oxononanoate aminotransferase